MNTSEFTEKSQQALRQAQQQALRRGHGEVDGEHLLLALLQERGGILSRMVQRLNGGDESLRQVCGSAYADWWKHTFEDKAILLRTGIGRGSDGKAQ